MHHFSSEFGGMNSIKSLLNQHQISSLQEIMLSTSRSKFDPADTSRDDFLEQVLSSVPFSSSDANDVAFLWADDDNSPPKLEERSKDLMLQQQLSTGDDEVFFHITTGGLGDIIDANSFFKPVNNTFEANEASVKALFNGFTGYMGGISNQSQHFRHSQDQNFGAAPAINQPVSNGSSGGGGQPRQRVRSRRGQATDPHSIAERLRRERIAERMKALQELVPNANKTDKASMLDEIIDYVKFLQLQVKVLSMSRLGGAAAVAPMVDDEVSLQGHNCNGTQTASSSHNNNMNEGMTATEHQVAKLMEEDTGSAMQYLQGKGICLMPITLATAISTSTATTSHSMKPLLLKNNHLQTAQPPLLNPDCPSPTSPSTSVLTVQFAASAGEPPP